MNNRKQNKIRTFLIIAINVIFVLGLFLAEFQYISSVKSQTIEKNEESFLNTNKSLVSMTDNYLVGESHLCRSWSNYLKNNVQTMEEAIEFVRESITDDDVMGHIVYKTKTNLTGLSTKPHASDSTNFTVSYSSIKSMVFTSEGEGVNISSTYINPVNGSPSIAFYREIKLLDPDDHTQEVDAYLLRVVLRDNFKKRWTFPSGSFEHLAVSIIDKDGNYIISGKTFKNNNFFEFYKSYNKSTDESMARLKEQITSDAGLMTMYNSVGEKCYIAHSDFLNSVNWIILCSVPAKDILDVSVDWLLITILGIGLAALFIIDLAFLLVFNKNLTETAKVAESASRAKTIFLSNMSHEIRTPMNAIVGFNNIVLNDPTISDKTRNYLTKSEASAEHLLQLINDILDMSRIESGKMVIKNEEFSFKDVVEYVNSTFSAQCRDNELEYVYQSDNQMADHYIGDAMKLRQVLINILGNAVKFTEKGGQVSLSISKESELEDKDNLYFVIKDTGIGISKEFLPHIFESFAQENTSTTNKYGSSGLGLPITKNIIEMMGGSIHVDSEKGVGSTFTITIPLVKSQNKKVIEEASQAEEVDFTNMHILVAEDMEVNAEIMQIILEEKGIIVDLAENGKIAVEKFANSEPGYYAAILMDMRMPEMDGVEATKAIRSMNRSDVKDIPIIALSANAFEEDIQKSLQAGLNAHLTKPIQVDVLFATLKKLIKD